MTKRFISVLLLLFPLCSLLAQEGKTPLFLLGLKELREGNSHESAGIFSTILADSSLANVHAEALFWFVKSTIASERYNHATEAVEQFLTRYPEHKDYPEAVYMRGRLYLLENNPNHALVTLYDFFLRYPAHALVPSAKYWMGEALIHLGQLKEADKIFIEILDEYPQSVKREASQYRRQEIALLLREKELLDLLQWSHEEYLRRAEKFYKKEKEYREAMSHYREQYDRWEKGNLTWLDRQKALGIKERLLELKNFYVGEIPLADYEE